MSYRSVSGCIRLYFVYPDCVRYARIQLDTLKYAKYNIRNTVFGCVSLRLSAFHGQLCASPDRMQIVHLGTCNTLVILQIHETELGAAPAHHGIRLYLAAFGQFQIQCMNTLERTQNALEYSQIHLNTLKCALICLRMLRRLRFGAAPPLPRPSCRGDERAAGQVSSPHEPVCASCPQ